MTRPDASRRGTRRAGARLTLSAVAAASALAMLLGRPVSGAGFVGDPPVGVDTPMSSPAGLLAAGPRTNGTGVLPDGRLVTPVGTQVPVGLQPINVLLTHDSSRLVVVDAGFDDAPTQAIANGTHRFLWTVDTTTMTATSFEDDAATYGLAETHDGTLYVAEGNGATNTDAIGIFAPALTSTGAPTYVRTGSIALDPSKPVDQPWGIALSPDEARLYVAGFSSDTLITVDLASRSVAARTPTGQYPYGVVVSRDGAHVYVSNWGLYNQEADSTENNVPGRPNSPIDPPPATLGGYNTDAQSSVWTYSVASGGTPAVQARTRIGLDINGDDVVGGALPSALALSPDQKTLAVSASNDDLVELLDVSTTVSSTALPSVANGTSVTTSKHPARSLDMHVITGGPTGAQPNALAWSPDGRTLFVAEGGRNAIAVVDPARAAGGTPSDGNRSAVRGRIPTGWYPSSLAVTPDGQRLYIGDMQGLGSGPNGHIAGLEYDPNTLKGLVQAVDLGSACGSLSALTNLSDQDNGLYAAATGPGTAIGDGTVVPTHYGAPPSSAIKHVFIIIKENRTFDQELGDYAGAERDQTLVMYGQHVTPNLHAATAQFANGDNFYANSEVSIDGHYAIDTGQINEFLQKLTSSNYAGKFPYGEWDTLAENLPQGGFIWNNASRGHVTARVYGEGTYVVGVAPEELGKGVTASPTGQVSPALFGGDVQYDPRYPSQVDVTATPVNALTGNSDPQSQQHDTVRMVAPYDDEYRAQVFAQDMQSFAAASGNGAADNVLPQLNVMLLFDDHGNGDFAGARTPTTETAENDHALGEVINTISTSPFWKSSAVFVTEDDTQGGQDHIDAHRTFALVASPWVQHGRISHVHTSFDSITKTADLILGLPPTSLQEMTSASLADDFVGAGGTPDLSPYAVQANMVGTEFNRSMANSRNPDEAAAARLQQRVQPGLDQGGDILPEVERLEFQGQLEAHDPNAVPQPDVQQHTLSYAAPAAASAVMHRAAAATANACVNAAAAAAVEPEAAGGVAGVTALPDTAAPGGPGAPLALLVVAVTSLVARGGRRRRG